MYEIEEDAHDDEGEHGDQSSVAVISMMKSM